MENHRNNESDLHEKNNKMNRKHLTFSAILLVVLLLSFGGCQKETITDPHDPLIEKMKLVTDSIIQNTQVPGIVALVADYKRGIDWIYAVGLSDIQNQLPMNEHLTFRIGSNTKTMVGTVLLQLVDEGLLSLNDKLAKFFPDYPKSDIITIAMLANMSSGIFNYSDDEEWLYELFTNPTRVYAPHELVDIGFSHDFYFDPGDDFHYSNTNIILLGMIIEQITGNSLEAEVENRIARPLNLVNTALITSGTTLPGNHSRGYFFYDDDEYEDATEKYDISWAWAAGSAYSTPRELQNYLEHLVKGGLISDSLQQKRLNDMINVNERVDYGLAIYKTDSFYGHNGALPGFATSMYHSIEKDCTIIIYFNGLLDLHPDYLFKRFTEILFD